MVTTTAVVIGVVAAAKITAVPDVPEEALKVPAFAGATLSVTAPEKALVPSTVGMTLSVCPGLTVADAGVMLTDLIVGFGIIVVFVPPQAVKKAATTESRIAAKMDFFIFLYLSCQRWQVIG